MDPNILNPKFKRLISRDDLHSNGDHLLNYVQLFNRRLTKRMSTCHMQIITAQHDQQHEPNIDQVKRVGRFVAEL